MNKKKIYIAGKVTGLPEQEVAEKFAKAQAKIEDMGFEVVNPVTLVKEHLLEYWIGKTLDVGEVWKIAMKVCIKAMLDCDAVVLLDNWELSKGAKIEYNLAAGLNIYIFNYSNWHLEGLKTIFK